MSPQPRPPEARREYEALRGGNYREKGQDAVAGERYTDIPRVLVNDLIARNAIRDVTGVAPQNGGDDA